MSNVAARVFSPGSVSVLAIVTAWSSAGGVAVWASCVAAAVTVLFGLLVYWPTRRRPSRLYHCTSVGNAGGIAAAIAEGDAGTLYCFTTVPTRRRRSFNVSSAATVVLQLVDVDYTEATVRYRSVDRAVRITGPITATVKTVGLQASPLG